VTELREQISKREFLFPWLSSAVVITLIRLLHATDVGYDATLQIQAAQNLVEGKGLTNYWPTSSDLADPFTLETLTHFPAGYSLYAAALIALGIDTSTLVKVVGAALTILGWWGWGRLALVYMADNFRSTTMWRLAAYWIAVVSPLLFTTRWGGTDIVLWAATPWVLERLTHATWQGKSSIRSDFLAGILIGMCVLSRYAGAFLAVYAGIVIIGQSQRRMALAARRFATLVAGVVPFVAVQVFINHFLAAGAVAPGGVSVGRNSLAVAATRVGDSVSTLAAANHGPFFWVPNSLRWWADIALEPAGLVLAGIVLIGVPVTLITSFRTRSLEWFTDVRIVAAGALVMLPAFLWTCGLIGTYVYVRDVRYYEQLRPLAVCIASYLGVRNMNHDPPRLRAVTWLSRAYVFAFVVMTAVEVAVVFTPTAAGATWRRAILGAEPRPWPSHQLTYESSAARRLALERMSADPNAVLITTREQWFYADPDADRSRIMRWENCESVRATHITGPARFLIFEADRADAVTPLQWPDRPAQRRSCWPRMPEVKLIGHFPDEGLRLLQADVPEGTRLEFRHREMASD
jgi:hypothetical protein